VSREFLAYFESNKGAVIQDGGTNGLEGLSRRRWRSAVKQVINWQQAQEPADALVDRRCRLSGSGTLCSHQRQSRHEVSTLGSMISSSAASTRPNSKPPDKLHGFSTPAGEKAYERLGS
jgi:hypothetical protein